MMIQVCALFENSTWIFSTNPFCYLSNLEFQSGGQTISVNNTQSVALTGRRLALSMSYLMLLHKPDSSLNFQQQLRIVYRTSNFPRRVNPTIILSHQWSKVQFIAKAQAFNGYKICYLHQGDTRTDTPTC